MSSIQVFQTPAPLVKRSYLLLAVLLPWSLEFDFGDWNLTMPTEPLLGLLGIRLAYDIYRSAGRWAPPYLMLSMAWIGWMAVCAAGSSMPQVSWKYWVVETGHWWVFGVGMVFYRGLWRSMLDWFRVSMLGFMLYTLIQHSHYGFRANQSMLAPMPFFPDHTMYAAVLAFLLWLPASFWPLRDSKVPHWFKPELIGIFFAASRAALLSVAVSAGGGIAIRWRGLGKWLTVGFGVLGILVVVAWPRLQQAQARDVSWQERLNRWHCAWAMVKERPWLGFGPGAFAFQYHPYQQAINMTRISVTEAPRERNPTTYGRGGGVHSEYWQAAVEMGIPGFCLWLALIVWPVLVALRAVRRSTAVLLLLLAFSTYLFHATLNQFLHDARIAFLFWGAAMTLALSVPPPGESRQEQKWQR